MTTLQGNRIATNFSKLPLAFCNGFTLKKRALWNRRPILQAGTTITPEIINFYNDIALNIPVSIRMDQTTNRLQQQLQENMLNFKQQNNSTGRRRINFKDGEILMREGDTNDCDCYILTEGVLIITINGVQIATISDHGMPIGEMSFLTGEARNATVTAQGSATLLRLPKKEKNQILRNNPTITMTILEALVSRLGDNNRKLIELNRKINEDTNKAIVQAEKTEQSYNTVIKALLREAGIKKGNLEVLLKMQDLLEEHLAERLQTGDTNSVYRIFLDFIEYYRKQAINESVNSIILKENMPPLMQNLF